MSKVSFIVPTLDEVEGIKKVLNSLPEYELEEMGYEMEVLVIDGGSSDGTKSKVKETDVELYREDGGKASAVRRGLIECDGDYVFLIDGDGSYPCDKIPQMVERLENGSSMVLGSRLSGRVEEGAMTRTNKFGNKILTGLANWLYGTQVSDLCTGLRGIKKESVKGMIPGKDFEIEAGLHVLLSKEEISEIPISYKRRKGESKLRVWDGFKIAKRLFVEKIKKKEKGF